MSEVFTGEVFGLPAAFVMPTVRESDPPHVREGIARRRIAATTGECPCGGRLRGLSRAQRRRLERGRADAPRLVHVQVEHEDGCPAIAEDTVAAVSGRRWSA